MYASTRNLLRNILNNFTFPTSTSPDSLLYPCTVPKLLAFYSTLTLSRDLISWLEEKPPPNCLLVYFVGFLALFCRWANSTTSPTFQWSTASALIGMFLLRLEQISACWVRTSKELTTEDTSRRLSFFGETTKLLTRKNFRDSSIRVFWSWARSTRQDFFECFQRARLSNAISVSYA
jgi:hypothetical protein